jgi:hypothetical protein
MLDAMKAARMALVSLLLGAGCGCASVRTIDVSNVPTFTIDAINASPERTVGQVMASGSRQFVVAFKKGDLVPLTLRASLGPIELQPGEEYVAFSQDVYLYFSSSDILLSPDGQRWAPVHDGAALQELFNLGEGTFQVGFGVKRGEKAAFTIVLARPPAAR